MDRITLLRERAINPEICVDEFYYKFYKCYMESEKTVEGERYAQAFYYAFSNLVPNISDGELIVGKSTGRLSDEEQKQWQEKYSVYADKLIEEAGGQNSHMAVDYDLVLKEGLNGIIKRIEGYMKAGGSTEFYECCRSCLEAVIKYSENYADEAERLAEETEDLKRKAELRRISEICRNVPANPAQDFYEAVQSVHFITHCVTMNPFIRCAQQFQLGRPDRYLFPYYKKDIENGKITKEEAQLLLDCLGIQINMRVPSGLSSGYMVGGRDENGRVVANELTEMCMQVIEDIKLVYPSVGLCWTEEMDDMYLKKACEILLHGRSHPAIFGDDTIAKGLESYGVPKCEAHNYIHSTCVEITPVAASNVWVASPYENMVQLLLDNMTEEYDSFEGLLKAVLDELDMKIKANFEEQNRIRKIRVGNMVNPLLSCLVNDCLERGLDIEKGGARYNWIMPSFVGMANLVDSLHAVKQTVFENKELTMKELKEILDSDFEGNEALRLRLLNNIPKYGNDIDDVDELFKRIITHIVKECEKYEAMHSNGRLIPSVFCWIMHEIFGSSTGATPDGRKAGFPLGDGSGPCQGREKNGPTASLISSTKWEHHKLIGGVAVNMKFAKNALGEDSVQTMMSLVKTYLKRGGFEMQINVTDRETLEKARKNPEEYRDLVVRIGGYSDYFVRLSSQMQEEVILRTEHKL